MRTLTILLFGAIAMFGSAVATSAAPPSSQVKAFGAHALGDYVAARELLTPLAESGDRDAKWRLGVLLANGQGGPRDFAQAFQLFLAAAEAGHLRAHYDVGLMYEYGEGRAANEQKAAIWYERGAKIGCGECASALGLTLLDGYHVYDASQAEHWFRLAADLDDPYGMVLLARLLIGIHGEASTDEALKLLDAAIERGWHGARLRRAWLLWSSHRNPEDARRGVREMQSLLKDGFLDGSDTQRTAVLHRLMRSAALGWGMRQDWSVALSYAAELDSIIKANELDEEFSWLRSDYPFFDVIRSLMTGLDDQQKAGAEMSCASAKAILKAVETRLLPVQYLDPATAFVRNVELVTYRCNDIPADKIDPTHEAYERLQGSLSLNLLFAERILPSAAHDGIGFAARPKAISE